MTVEDEEELSGVSSIFVVGRPIAEAPGFYAGSSRVVSQRTSRAVQPLLYPADLSGAFDKLLFELGWMAR